METICIMCPMGCPLSVTECEGVVNVVGNTCKRGHDYGIQEYTAPSRTVTSLIRVCGHVVPVKTTKPVPKSKIFDVLHEIEELQLQAIPDIGTVVIRGVCDTDSDIVVTRQDKE